jgi:hypothetical protein
VYSIVLLLCPTCQRTHFSLGHSAAYVTTRPLTPTPPMTHVSTFGFPHALNHSTTPSHLHPPHIVRCDTSPHVQPLNNSVIHQLGQVLSRYSIDMSVFKPYCFILGFYVVHIFRQLQTSEELTACSGSAVGYCWPQIFKKRWHLFTKPQGDRWKNDVMRILTLCKRQTSEKRTLLSAFYHKPYNPEKDIRNVRITTHL